MVHLSRITAFNDEPNLGSLLRANEVVMHCAGDEQ